MQEFLILSKKDDLEYTEKFSNFCEVYFQHVKRKFDSKYNIEVIISEDYILNLIYPFKNFNFEDSKENIFNKLNTVKINGKYIRNYRNGEQVLKDFKEFIDCSNNIDLDVSSFEGMQFSITVRKNTLEISRIIL